MFLFSLSQSWDGCFWKHLFHAYLFLAESYDPKADSHCLLQAVASTTWGYCRFPPAFSLRKVGFHFRTVPGFWSNLKSVSVTAREGAVWHHAWFWQQLQNDPKEADCRVSPQWHLHGALLRVSPEQIFIPWVCLDVSWTLLSFWLPKHPMAMAFQVMDYVKKSLPPAGPSFCKLPFLCIIGPLPSVCAGGGVFGCLAVGLTADCA